jgi:hypothetical protein
VEVKVRYLKSPNPQVQENLLKLGAGDVRDTPDIYGVAESIRAYEVGGLPGAADRGIV